MSETNGGQRLRYSGSRYPSAAQQQHAIRSEKYRYQPREPVSLKHYAVHGQQQGNGHSQNGPPRDDGKKHKKDKGGKDHD